MLVRSADACPQAAPGDESCARTPRLPLGEARAKNPRAPGVWSQATVGHNVNTPAIFVYIQPSVIAYLVIATSGQSPGTPDSRPAGSGVRYTVIIIIINILIMYIYIYIYVASGVGRQLRRLRRRRRPRRRSLGNYIYIYIYIHI